MADSLSGFLTGLPAWLELPILGRLLLALLLGAAVGLEREISGKPAGLRTIILICLGAELLTEMSIAVAGLQLHGLVRADPARIAAGVVTGIGFIGAGTILVHRGSVVGLTTAATLWVAAAIGIAVGARAYVAAVGATVLVMATLVVLRWLERHLVPDRIENVLRITLVGDDERAREIEAWLEELGFKRWPLEVARRGEELTLGFRIIGRAGARDRLMRRLAADPKVRSARVE
ncbi:MAG: MgtC/SapB family protein [Gemmatimonadota bacterium]